MRSSSTRIGFPGLARVRQKTDAHCGPAVVKMLAAFVGKKLDQDRIVQASGVGKRFRKHGMTVEEMGHAVSILLPEMVFWRKENASVTDLEQLVNDYKVPVGVEWQGEFGKYSDGDNGHYSVVTYVNPKDRVLALSDPFIVFAGKDRKFSIEDFTARWWDDNVIWTPAGEERVVTDKHVLFLITEASRRFPYILGMRRIV